ncbi:hypothetical protein WB44_01105 [Synechococcus sp. WH 8020]|nr:hypothetical protein WB44_01105 [Synechococcus sp. WH 8020]
MFAGLVLIVRISLELFESIQSLCNCCSCDSCLHLTLRSLATIRHVWFCQIGLGSILDQDCLRSGYTFVSIQPFWILKASLAECELWAGREWRGDADKISAIINRIKGGQYSGFKT